MRRFYFPTETVLTEDVIEIDMLLPSGQLGIRHYGARVVVSIDRALGVRVTNFVGRLLLEGAVNAGSVSWSGLPEREGDWEICRTALEMIEARVAATVKLFSRHYFDASWLTDLARWEAGL